MFNDDELNKLDGGYSISETDDNVSALNDIMSQNSILRAVGANAELYSPHKGFDNDEGAHLGGAILNEMAAQKQKFGKKLREMEKQMEQLRAEKVQLTQVLETQRQNFKFALHQQEQKSASVIKELRDSQRKKVDEMPAFQEKLELYKQELACHQLLISEEAYVELKTKTNQTLKEFIQVKVYETLQTYLRDLEQYQYENQETGQHLIVLRAQAEREKNEKESY